MIWLSPMTGTGEGSVYFDIRDINPQPTGNGTDGLIRGLLGDGQREVWGEVQLGKQPQVKILPLWTDDGQVEELAAEIDEELLKKQLLEAARRVFSTVGKWAATASFDDLTQILQGHDWLAA
jgi:hypothetical protein